MKKTTKSAKTVTFPVPVFTVTARKPRNYAVSGVSGVKMSGVPVSVRIASALPSLSSFTRPVSIVPENYRGEDGKAWAGVPYAFPAVNVPTWADIADGMHKRKLSRLVLPLDVHVMSLKAVRAVIRNRLKHGGRTGNEARPETWTAYGKNGKAPSGNDYTAKLFEYRHDISEWYGMESDKAHRAGHWERLERLEQEEQAHTDKENALLLEAKEHGRKATQARKAGAYVARYYHEDKRDELRREARKEHKKATAVRQQFFNELTTTAGDGAELYSVAYSYLWEKLSRDGLTAKSILFGKGKDKRDYVKTVYQWGFTMVNRSTLGNLQADKQTSAWAEYIERTARTEERDNTEDMEENTLERSPRYWDNTATLDNSSTAENVDKMDELIQKLKLSNTQKAILQYRLQGMGNDLIAQKLGVTKDTVRTHMKRMRKYVIARMELTPEKVAELSRKYGTSAE